LSGGLVVLVVVNGVLALAGAVFAVVAIVRPAALSHSARPTSGERFYSRLYAARGIPIGVLAAAAPWAMPPGSAAFVLIAAAVAQVGDVVVGAGRRDPRMALGSGAAALAHVATAVALTWS
jgi:hypothetical protein